MYVSWEILHRGKFQIVFFGGKIEDVLLRFLGSRLLNIEFLLLSIVPVLIETKKATVPWEREPGTAVRRHLTKQT